MIKKFIIGIIIFFSLNSIILANFSNDFYQIKSGDLAIIMKESEKGNFSFKEKNYNADFGIRFLTDFSNNARIKVDNNILKNFLEKKYFEKNYFLIIVTKDKKIILEKFSFLDFLIGNFNTKTEKEYEFVYEISENDFSNDILTSSILESNFLKSKIKKNNKKLEKLFNNLDEKSLNILKEKFKNSNSSSVKIFLKILENEVYNNGKNIIIF